MKITFFFLILTYFSSAQSAYVLERVNGIDGSVSALEFDIDGNAYVISLTSTPHFYKLSSTKDILWEITGDDYYNFYIKRIHINSQKDVYLELDSTFIALLREDTLTFELIAEFDFFTAAILDEEGNLYFCGNDGINLLRPNSTSPIVIKNLENHGQEYNIEKVAIDDLGNVYFAVYDPLKPSTSLSLAVLTKEEKQEEIPSAQLFDLSSLFWIDGIKIVENDAWLLGTDFNISYIKKFSGSNLKDVRVDDYYRVQFAEVVKDQLYVEAVFPQNYTYAFSISSDGVVQKIPELENVPRELFSLGSGATDKDGNVYFGFYSPWDEGQLLIVRPDGNNTWINFPKPVQVKILILDENEDLWIGTGGEGFYVLKKGETTVTQVSVPPGIDQNFSEIKVNKKTNEIYVLTSNNGLYFVKNDSD